MKISERTLRIGAASFLSLLTIGVAYVVSGPNIFASKTANAESTQEVLQAYSTKDTDGDGLPDWEEALYGTDPNKAISNSFGIPDGEAAKEGKLTPNALSSQLAQSQGSTTLTDADFQVPAPAAGSITDEFSHEFFQEYVQTSGGQPLSADDEQTLITKLMGEFSQKASATFTSNYTVVSVRTNPGMSTSNYAAEVEAILQGNEVTEGTGDPVILMDNLLEKNDESARGKLKTLATAYGTIRDQLIATQVPPQLVDSHLELIRSFDSLAKATTLITSYEKDPLGAMGAVSIFTPTDEQVVDGLRGISSAILASGEPATDAPGAYIVNAVRSTEGS